MCVGDGTCEPRIHPSLSSPSTKNVAYQSVKYVEEPVQRLRTLMPNSSAE